MALSGGAVPPTIRVLTDPPQTASAAEGVTILANLHAAGIPLSHNCQAGNCGVCKCELIEGEILELPYSEYALSPEERARNLVLACRSQVWGDCVVRPLEAEDLVLHPSRILRCRVLALEELTHDIRGLRLRIEAGGPFTFSAGQYASIELAPEVAARNYSMANRPDAAELEFHVRRVPNGQASGYVFERLRPGDEIRVRGPLGTAYLREAHAGPILAVAGGSGMAPIKSIVETALAADPARAIHLYFGVRAERDVYLESHLAALARRHPNFRYQIVLSEPDGASARRSGLVADAFADDFESFVGFKAYLAGPPPMVEAAEQRLIERGKIGRA